MSAYDLVIRGGTVATAANTIACDTLCCTQPRPVSRNRVGFRMPAWGERSTRWVEAKDRRDAPRPGRWERGAKRASRRPAGEPAR